MASQGANRVDHRIEHAPFPPEQSRESQVERLRITREGLAMKREGEVSLFREESEVSELLELRAGAEIARQVAFADGVSASLNCIGSSEIAFRRIKHGQIVKNAYDIGMFGPQRFPQDVQRPLKQRLGLRILAPVLVENCKTFDSTSHKGMLGSQRFLTDGQRQLNQRLRLHIISSFAIESSEVF